MSWELHPAKSEFARFAADWDRLNGELYASHPFFDSRFVGPLLKYFGNGRERLCIFRANGIVRAALILQPRGGGRWATFRPAQAQITPLLIAEAGLLPSLLEALPGIVWWIEFLAVDPRYAPKFAYANGRTIASRQATTIGVESGIDFRSYWKKRPKNLQANIRRYINRLEREAGSAQLSLLTAPESMYEAVRRFGEMEGTGWKADAGTAVSVGNAQGLFYAEVLASFAAGGQALVSEFCIGGKPAASRLLIGNAGMLVILKTAYDKSLARFAPSRLLLYRLLERQLAEHPEKTVEFYTNATREQAEWSTFSCNIQNVQLFRNDIASVAYMVVRSLKRCLVRGPSSIPLKNDAAATLEVLSCNDVQALADGDGRLEGFAPGDGIEDSLDWFDLMQRQVYPDDPQVRYYYASERGKPTAILPMRQSQRWGVRMLESLGNYYTSLYSPLIDRAGNSLALRGLLSAVARESRDLHVMRFAPMDPDAPTYAVLLNALRANGWVPLTFFCFGNWFLRVEGGWEGYLRSRSANLRSSIKRRSRVFAAQGGTLDVTDGAEGLDEAIAAFQEVYSASWKKPEPYPDFVPSLIRLLAERGMLRLGVARLQGRPVAAQLWFAGQGKASIYKVAYHHAYASLSPGTVLTSHLLQHVIEQDHVEEVDFLIGDDEYKKIWMSHRRERWGIVAFNPRTLAGSALLLKELAGRMVKATAQRIVAAARSIGALSGLMMPQKNAPSSRQTPESITQPEKKMVWKTIPIEQFADHAAQWDRLVRRRPGTPFLESAFLKSLLAEFGTGDERLCLLEEEGRLRAAAIMQRDRRAVWQSFQPSQLPLGAWITDGQIELISAIASLLRQLPGITMALGASQIDPRMQQRPEDTATLRTQDYIATAWVDIDGSFEEYWEARGKNLKQNTRKQRNKLQSEGIQTHIECITMPEMVAKAIEDYGVLESAGWKGADGTAIAPGNAQGRFYREMLEKYCAEGRGRIYRYRFDDKVVAMDLCIHDENVLVILKTAYDETYKSVSPSTLMRQEQFQQLFAEKRFRRIEFFGKVMEWHTRWTSQSRTIYHATGYRWAWLKSLHARRAAIAGEVSVAPAER